MLIALIHLAKRKMSKVFLMNLLLNKEINNCHEEQTGQRRGAGNGDKSEIRGIRENESELISAALKSASSIPMKYAIKLIPCKEQILCRCQSVLRGN